MDQGLANRVLAKLKERGGNGKKPAPSRFGSAARAAWDAVKKDDFSSFEKALDAAVRIRLAEGDR